MKTLIIQTAFIGDVVLITPLIEKLKKKGSQHTIDILVRKGNESLLANNPHIHKVLIFDKKNNKYKNLYKVIKQVRAESYDQVINVQRFMTTGIITILSGAREKIGFNKNPFSFLYTKSIKHHISTDHPTHEVYRNLSLLSKEKESKSVKPKLYPSDNDYKSVNVEGEYICMAPASEWFTKKFPKNKWCELINAIPKSYKILLLGGPGDIQLCEDIQQKTDNSNVEVWAGKLSFLQSAALIEKATITFTNDSAPLHFASAMNAPVAAIFCSTIPQFGFGPLSDISHIIETEKELNCRPCGLHGLRECPKQHFNCADIDIERILVKTNLK